MVEIIYGRAGSGKTFTLTEKIKTLAGDGTPVCLIVPEQLSLTREFAINSAGIKNVSVLSFSRFANTVFRTLGGTAKKHPDKAMMASAIFVAIENVYDRLVYFKNTAFTNGFISALTSAFSEFDTNCISENAVMTIPEGELSKGVKNKYRDMFLIYNEYKKMWTDEYKDPSGDIIGAASLLELSDIYKDTVFAFDGFFGFTTQQLLLIAQIVLQSPQCIFSFTTDMQSDIFEAVTKEVKNLEKICNKQGVAVNYSFVGDKNYKHSTTALRVMEKSAFSHIVAKSEKQLDGVSVFSAKNINDELNYIACKIKNDVLSGKYRYRDIAVISPGAEEIKFLVSSVFKKHDIPVFCDTSVSLANQPLCAFVQSAFDIVNYGFDPQYVFRLLKTGLAGMDFDDISLLENYVRVWRLKNRHWNDENWQKNPNGIGGFGGEIDTQRLEKINSLRFFVQRPIEKFKKSVGGTKSVTAILMAVYTLLEDFKVRQNLEKCASNFLDSGEILLYNEYMRVYGVFVDMLDSIYETCKTRKMSAVRFCDMIGVCAVNCAVSTRPSRTDEVVFLSLGQARAEDKKCVYIPQLNSKYLPSSPHGASLITEADKRVFSKFDISVSMDVKTRTMREYFDFYCAATAPCDELCLSYSIFSVTGDVQPRSHYLDMIVQAVGADILDENDLPPEFYLVSIEGAGDYGAKTGDKNALEAVYDIKGYRPKEKNTQECTLSDSVVDALYGQRLRLSFSGMEEFVCCPFKFFVNHGLRAKKSEIVEFKPNDIGTFIHKGLENLLSGGYDISTPEAVDNAVEKISDNYMKNELGDCVGHTKRFDFLFERAKSILTSACHNVANEVNNSDFKPYAFELDISEFVPPYSLENGHSLSLRGSIDRVDMTDDGLVKIIDYKSGKQLFSYKKMYNGLSLQLPVYASAVREKFTDSKIAAMYYLKVGVPKVEFKGTDGITDEEYKQQIEKFYKRDGVFSNDENLAYRLDNTGRLFAKIKDDRLLDDDAMNKLIDFASQKITDVGCAITNGVADIDPITDSDIKSCDYCDYSHICGFSNGDREGRKLEDLPEQFLKEE